MGKILLFVCGGNTCRSPMAMEIAKARLKQLNRTDISVESAGVSASEGDPMTSEAAKALSSLGITVNPEDHRSRKVSRELVHKAHRIYCMSADHRKRVNDLHRSAEYKTFLLDEGGIADPLDYGQDVYDACAECLRERIWRALDTVVLETVLSKQ